MAAFSPSRAPIKTSLLSEERVYDPRGAFFKVPAKKEGQKLILFGGFEAEVNMLELSETEEELLDFYQPNPKVIYIMENMSYNFKDKLGQNFGKGVRTNPCTLP